MSPFKTWSCLSTPEALQIWLPSEQTLLERDFDIRLCSKASLLVPLKRHAFRRAICIGRNICSLDIGPSITVFILCDDLTIFAKICDPYD